MSSEISRAPAASPSQPFVPHFLSSARSIFLFSYGQLRSSRSLYTCFPPRASNQPTKSQCWFNRALLRSSSFFLSRAGYDEKCNLNYPRFLPRRLFSDVTIMPRLHLRYKYISIDTSVRCHVPCGPDSLHFLLLYSSSSSSSFLLSPSLRLSFSLHRDKMHCV